MKFGVCHIVDINDGMPFKDPFVATCKSLDLNYDVLSKRNHKRLTIEHFHRFLNKAVTIAMEGRQSNNVFVPTGIVIGCTWNSTHIDRTSILCRTIAIGRELRFPIDINSLALPQLT